MAEEKNYMLPLIAIVAIVAIVGLVIMFMNVRTSYATIPATQKTASVIQGSNAAGNAYWSEGDFNECIRLIEEFDRNGCRFEENGTYWSPWGMWGQYAWEQYRCDELNFNRPC